MNEPASRIEWNSGELDAIVSDYFEMLQAELSHKPYVKSRHRAALRAQIGRTDGSVEFKHQNISAVLVELGLPWIPGYKPAKNYQGAIFDAIDRYLGSHPAALIHSPETAPVIEPKLGEVFVSPPSVRSGADRRPERLDRLVRKYDPVERDFRNRSLGRAGEAFVFRLEQSRLRRASRSDLADKVRWVADQDGDGAGYDVLSFQPDGERRLIEVKTTNGAATTPFFLSRNECDVAIEQPENWRLYRVHLFAQEPRIFTLSPPLNNLLTLVPEIWKASF